MNLIRIIPAEGKMKRLVSVLIVLLVFVLFFSCKNQNAKVDSLTIWTYDSFVSEWGPGPALAKLYQEKTGTKIVFQSKGDGGALLAEILARGKDAEADAVIGLDDKLAPRALESGLFTPLHLTNLKNIDKKLLIDSQSRLVPYDYGNFAFIWDSKWEEKELLPPKNLEQMTRPEYKKKIIIMDPRTSTPGLGLLAWTQAVYGDNWEDYWKRLAPSILAMTPGWDTGYGLFTKGEAPLVLSYSTSPAYHKAYENSERYRALVFEEGHPLEIELAGVLINSKKRKAAEGFLDFLLTEEAQSILPETQWMFPANTLVKLPDSFDVVPKDVKSLTAAKVSNLQKDPERAVDLLQAALR